jgi:hypothetical protein
MLDMNEEDRIRRKELATSKRMWQVVRVIGCSRSTVNKMLETIKMPHYPLAEAKESPVSGLFKHLVDQWLAGDEK